MLSPRGPLQINWHIHAEMKMQQVSSSIGKESACNTRAWVGKIPWKRQWQSTPVFLSEEFHGQRSLASYCPQGLKGCMPQPLMPKKLNLNGAMKIYKTFSSRTNNTQKRYPLHYRGLECKSKKSRATWSNRQIWPWSTKWSRAKANRVLPRELTGHSKHPLPTTQEKTLHMDITRWSILKSDWLYSLQPKMEKHQKHGQELTVAQTMNFLLPNSDLTCRK